MIVLHTFTVENEYEVEKKVDYYKLKYGKDSEKSLKQTGKLPYQYLIATMKLDNRKVSALLDFEKDVVVFEYQFEINGTTIVECSQQHLYGTPNLASMECSMFSVLDEFSLTNSPQPLKVSCHYKTAFFIKEEQLDKVIENLYLKILSITAGAFDFKISHGLHKREMLSDFTIYIYYEKNKMAHEEMRLFFSELIQDELKYFDYEAYNE